jgi:hypothetical protein
MRDQPSSRTVRSFSAAPAAPLVVASAPRSCAWFSRTSRSRPFATAPGFSPFAVAAKRSSTGKCRIKPRCSRPRAKSSRAPKEDKE